MLIFISKKMKKIRHLTDKIHLQINISLFCLGFLFELNQTFSHFNFVFFLFGLISVKVNNVGG